MRLLLSEQMMILFVDSANLRRYYNCKNTDFVYALLSTIKTATKKQRMKEACSYIGS